jgi:DNA-binding beta-propeller fold protein YncE
MKSGVLSVLISAFILLSGTGCTPSPEAIAAQSATEMARFAATALPTERPVASVWSITGDPSVFDTPDGLAVDQQGYLYVMDSGNNRLQKFDSNGQSVAMWGTKGTGDGQFDCQSICMVAVDGQGNVFATDGSNARVEKFDSSGKFLAKWGSFGSGDGQFNSPFGIGVDAQGNIYVGDVGNSRVQKFTGSGKFLAKWGSSGYQDGQFSENLADIAIDAQGNVYVTDRSYGLQKFDSRGRFLARLRSCGDSRPLFSAAGVAVDVQGNIYVSDALNKRICKLDPYGRFLNRWDGSGSAEGPLDTVGGIAVDQLGNVYAAELFANRVRKFHQP